MYPQFYNSQPTQLLRVNGIESAKSYPTMPNSTIALFDSNDDVFYIKSTDASNFPTIRKFRFIEEIDKPEVKDEYVTVSDFNALKEELNNVKQLIQQSANKWSDEQLPTNGENDEVNKSKSKSLIDVSTNTKKQSQL